MTEWPQLDDIHRAIRAHDGAASAPEIARHLGKAPTGIGRIIRQALTRPWWLPIMVRVTCELCPWSCLTTNNFWGEVHGSAHQLATHEGDPR